MPDGPPDLIAIDHDEYHAEHVGHTSDGNQFFLTTPFVPPDESQEGSELSKEGSEFVALYLFDAAGNLLDAHIDSFGPRAHQDREARRQAYERRLRELGQVTFGRIEVEPFAIERFGTTFGLVPLEPETDDEDWVVVLLPGDYMAFIEPWDSGTYDT